MDEERRFLKIHAPRAWNNLVERLKEEVGHINGKSVKQALVLEVKSANLVSIKNVDKNTGLTVEYSRESFRVCVDCGFSKQSYRCDFDLQKKEIAFVSKTSVPWPLDKFSKKILELIN